MATPTDRRGALWWMEERAVAEGAVVAASRSLDMELPGTPMRALWSQQLDRRLDRLEEAEDRCDGILLALRATAPSWVAEAAEERWVRGATWAEVARRHGMEVGRARSEVMSALVALG